MAFESDSAGQDVTDRGGSAPGTSIALATLPNLRDLGGWVTADGQTVVAGKLYRSTALHDLSAGDTAVLEGFGIRTVYDLRTAVERDAAPDKPIPGATEVFLDVLADAATAIPANLAKVLSDPAVIAGAQEHLGDGKAAKLIAGTYTEIVTLPSALTAYRELFLGLIENSTPSLFHCTTGKDRTGWGAAVLLSLLGVPRDDVVHEYLLTNDQLLPTFTTVFDTFESAGGDPAVLRAVLGVDQVYLERAFTEVDEKFGGIEGYVSTGLGIDADGQRALRANYLAG